ncbi:MAG TPA: DUF4180 domain-containing protein [Thermomicrobiales bacterium]|jgi:hypothetical protein
MTELLAIGDERVWCYPADGPPIDSERRATDLVGEASYHRATLIAVPVDRLGPDFFQLRSGVAGMIAQKLVNYRLRCAVIGDITAYLAASDALRDWVRESNRGRDLWFVDSLDDLAARLNATGPPQ